MFSIKNRFIFVHPQKCGGTSIEELLQSNYNENDLILAKHETLTQQINEVKLLTEFSEDMFFKFGVVRNPWDRMVSWYFFIKEVQVVKDLNENGRITRPTWERISSMSFHDFVLATETNFAFFYHKSLTQFHFHNKKCGLDYLIRFENYEKDVNHLIKLLNLPSNTVMPHALKANTKRNYKDFYTEETKQIIAKNFAEDIEWLGYTF